MSYSSWNSEKEGMFLEKSKFSTGKQLYSQNSDTSFLMEVASMRFKTALTMLFLTLTSSPALAAGHLDSGINAFEKGDFRAAYQILKPLADAANVQAKTRLGLMSMRGDGLPQNKKKGIDLLRFGATRGDGFAQGRLGVAYLTGDGVARDTSLAEHWLLAAASRGDETSKEFLNYLYPGWKYLGYLKEQHIFVDLKFASTKDDLSYTWIKYKPGKGKRESKRYLVIDCENGKVGTAGMVDYDLAGRVVKSDLSRGDEVEMTPVKDKSLESALFKMMCNTPQEKDDVPQNTPGG